MNITHGLYCSDSMKIYQYWQKNYPSLARQVDDIVQKYEQALAQSGRTYYKSQLLELAIRKVGLLKIMEVVVTEDFTRSNRKKLRASDHFRIIFKTEDETRDIMIALGLISEQKDNKKEDKK